ncbi:MAG: histidine--tRNA ligase [Gaiellaceae bacterium]
MKFEAPRGTRDILPADSPLWRRVTGEMERVCALHGYRPITTPVFEDTALFARTSGEGSDVVTKEMYTFEDRSGRSLTLRPELTAPICRAYLEHGLHREPQPQKLHSIATSYRYGRPQKGRYREFWQLSVEAIGSDDPAIDAEVIDLYDMLLGNLGVTEYRLELNSIGDANCRPAYVEALRAWLAAHEGDLDEETRDQARRNPLRALDNFAAKPPHVRDVLAQAPAIGDALCDACREHFAAVRRSLDAYDVAYELVPTLVRGLDYYTRTTFEFVGPGHGAQSTICGGGRYDGLMEEIGGPATPALGFGAGVERLLIAVEDAGVEPPEREPVEVFIATEEGAPRELVIRWLKQLRAHGITADTDYAGRSLKGQLTQAGRLGAHTTVIVGADRATLRRTGEQDEPLDHGEVPGRLLR